MATPLDYAVIIVYFIAILGYGSWFARYTKTTKDFFFGGQRFSWWLIAMSCVATVVGSYSFIKYSAAGYQYGLSSSMTYLNDWVILPFFVLGWFPIIYFTRVTSIPEYFERRFDRKTRVAALILILVYMIGYVGINFYTLGVALQPLLNINLYAIVLGIAVVSAIYMHAGGQTSVIMTDLLQGFLLLAAGLVLLFLGVSYLGGWENFFSGLPGKLKLPLADFNVPPQFNFVGIFWQDALASSVAFYFMNQGVMMRFMSVRSPRDGYKAMFVVVLFLMPVAAIAISNAGWLGRAMVTHGMISADTDPNQIFVTVTSLVTRPGVFGLILAALVAALMSTIDTLITAVSAVFVNDIWKPFVAADRPDKHYLFVARLAAIGATLVGVILVPVFAHEKSIYVAHGKFIATVTPAMVVVILLSVFSRRFTPAAAFWTLIGGSALTFLSAYFPQMIVPFAHGVSPDGGFKFMRALFGMVCSLGLAAIISCFTRPKSDQELEGLVIHSFDKAKEFFKGGVPNEEPGKVVRLKVRVLDQATDETVFVGTNTLKDMNARPGDLVYVSDPRWYFGGLRSLHAKAEVSDKIAKGEILLSKNDLTQSHLKPDQTVTVERIM